MDSYKDVFYSAGLPALISTGITLVYFILKAYQFAVHAVSHQTEGRLAEATPSGRKQEHGSIEGEQGRTQVPEQVPRSISDQYGTGVQQPSGSLSLSGGRQNVCLVACRNAEEYPVEPSVPENAKRLPSRRNRSTENGDGHWDPVAHMVTPQEYLQKVAAGQMPQMNNHEMFVELAAKNDQTKILLMEFRDVETQKNK